MKVLAGILVIFNLAFINAQRLCETPCTREYNPVCGTNGESFQIFSNPCILRNQRCKDGRQWMQTSAGNCKHLGLRKKRSCEAPCSKEIKPICGTDGEQFKRFSNLCMLKNEYCKDGHDWHKTDMEFCVANFYEKLPVKRELSKECPQICPALYAPVCGFNGEVYKQFSNNCLLRSNNCLHENNWVVVSFDKCA